MLISLISLFGLLLIIAVTRWLGLKYLYLAGSYLIDSPKLIAYGVAILLLPGTLIHELSHWLVAELLRVPTGKLELLPQIETNNRVRLGSLQIAQTDPFRRTLIGLAPLFMGLTVLFLIGNQFPQIGWPPTLGINLKNLALFYGVLVVANTMFSSQKDLEVALLPTIVLILGSILVWKLPLNFSLPFTWTATFQNLLNHLNQILVVVLGLNILLLMVGILGSKILHR